MAKDRDSTSDSTADSTVESELHAGPGVDGVLLASSLARELSADALRAEPLRLHGALDGIDALRILSEPAICARIGVVVADAELPDMSGLGLLRRAAALQPLAARVLLVDESDSLPAADALPGLGLADAWEHPQSLPTLLQRLLHERPALVRVHHLHRRLEAADGALERLESRFRSVRAAHDQLAASVRAVVGEAHDGPNHRQLARWWRDYGDWLELREGRYPMHRVALPLEQLLANGLDELTACAAGPFCDAWIASRPRVPPHCRVQMDPVLARQTLVRLLLGLSELASRSASLGWELAGTARQRLRLELRVSALRRDAPDPQLFEDPFARLPDGALAFLSMDLVMAGALCRAQGGELALHGGADGLRVELSLPAPPATTASEPPRGRTPQPVVPGGKAVL